MRVENFLFFINFCVQYLFTLKNPKSVIPAMTFRLLQNKGESVTGWPKKQFGDRLIAILRFYALNSQPHQKFDIKMKNNFNSDMNLEMENGVLIFVSAIFNIFLVTVMALVSIIIAVSQGLKKLFRHPILYGYFFR